MTCGAGHRLCFTLRPLSGAAVAPARSTPLQACTHTTNTDTPSLRFSLKQDTMSTVRRLPPLLTLALLAAWASWPAANGCSDMLLADPAVSPAVVGFRNLDFPPMTEARTLYE